MKCLWRRLRDQAGKVVTKGVATTTWARAAAGASGAGAWCGACTSM